VPTIGEEADRDVSKNPIALREDGLETRRVGLASKQDIWRGAGVRSLDDVNKSLRGGRELMAIQGIEPLTLPRSPCHFLRAPRRELQPRL
jgi:hypothetical protein